MVHIFRVAQVLHFCLLKPDKIFLLEHGAIHYLFLKLCKLQVVMMCEVWIKLNFLENTCYIF